MFTTEEAVTKAVVAVKKAKLSEREESDGAKRVSITETGGDILVIPQATLGQTAAEDFGRISSILIGRAPTLLCSHWSKWVEIFSWCCCLLSYAINNKLMASKYPNYFLPFTGSLWHQIAGASITREALDQ